MKFSVKQAQRMLFMLGVSRIPMIFFCRPKVLHLDENSCKIRIRLRRRTRNHLGSMYIAVFTVGADISAGIFAFLLVRERKVKASIAFKSFKADYHKRAMGDVYFICDSGKEIAEMVQESQSSAERVNRMIHVKAVCEEEEVASMEIELSVKVKQ